ncbi:MAG: hypothetical protein GF353_17895 [Candidatus Lokiarchaeota archaeon]|nr:hypothetical protein [Candidatus Lokiarchaeota archaeon]
MDSSFNSDEFSVIYNQLQDQSVKHRIPMILKLFGVFNKYNLKLENRYLLCNFIDQHSDILKFKEDIYLVNNQKSLNELFLIALNKARRHNLLEALYREYTNGLQAISNKKRKL